MDEEDPVFKVATLLKFNNDFDDSDLDLDSNDTQSDKKVFKKLSHKRRHSSKKDGVRHHHRSQSHDSRRRNFVGDKIDSLTEKSNTIDFGLQQLQSEESEVSSASVGDSDIKDIAEIYDEMKYMEKKQEGFVPKEPKQTPF